MSVTWTAGYAATTPYPMTHARILYTPASGAATASSEVEGYEAALALNPDTYSYWLPSLTPATWEVGFTSNFSPIAARRNLLRYSEQFENAAWSSFGTVAVTPNSGLSPTGQMTADTLAISAASGIYQIVFAVPLAAYTASVWVRADSNTTGSLVINTNLGDAVFLTVNVTTAWQRVSLSKTTQVGTSIVSIQLDGGNGANTIYAWGAQLEESPAATLYQPVTSDYPAADTYVPNAVDAVGIAAHSLAGQSVAVDTWDGAAWVEQVPAFAVTDNGPLLMLFQEVTTSRVRLRVDGIPQPVGVIYAGKALVMPQKAYVGLGQINLKRRTEYKINQTEGGLWAGRSIARVSLIAAYQWTHLTDAFYLANVEPFSFSARQYPFFLAARPSGYPEETTYAWVAADIAPERMGVLDFCSVGFEAIGYSRA